MFPSGVNLKSFHDFSLNVVSCTQQMSTDLRSKISGVSPDLLVSVPHIDITNSQTCELMYLLHDSLCLH